MATNLPSCLFIQFLEQLLKLLVNFTLLKYIKSQRSYGFLITKELSFGLPNFGFKRSFLSLLNNDQSLNYRNNTKRSHTQLDSRKQIIAFQDRVMTINIKEAQHPLKREKQVIDKSSIMSKISTKSMHRVLV